MKKLGIIDHNAGNLFSLENALKMLNVKYIITNKKKLLDECSHLILPGVGAFSPAMKSLKKNKLDKFLIKAASKNKPILGICLGMQMLFEISSEFGSHKGLSLIKGVVKKINLKNCKIPVIGWYKISVNKKSFLKKFNKDYVYLVHSYECLVAENDDIAATYTINEKKIVCAIQKKNIFAVQFHPEKSDIQGLSILKNFLTYK
jgi:imidazole glycerol-phosphate synthase subunit HisH